MKNKFSLFLTAASLASTIFALNSCVKDPKEAAAPPITSNTFTEGFDTVANLYSRGWVFNNNSRPQGAATWQQGIYEAVSGKTGISFDGWPAYFYKASPDEYIFAGYASGSGTAVLSSWMITPPLEFKNGDKISFYARSAGGYADRLQIRINGADDSYDVGFSENTVGKFTTLLGDINPTLTVSGFPTKWTKYEYTISGVTAPFKKRIAFRYFVTNGGPNGANSNAIGIDEFKLTRL